MGANVRGRHHRKQLAVGEHGDIAASVGPVQIHIHIRQAFDGLGVGMAVAITATARDDRSIRAYPG